ncbi:SMC-Scp complex subunit ScpB [Allosalinactinospora lopnorensis]|uniref:SMC-Scp complex subunit ScpB n=1 Tax=Allosalinactinospora lopnorensis TaxID=1352348 RepID=UPI0009E26A1B|nr:SMC-Scp complex subunit ScpB [Allosalinactinospora lopnorensis]
MSVGENTPEPRPGTGGAQDTLRRDLEAVLMVVDQPVAEYDLARAFGRDVQTITDTLEELSREYTEQGRGFDLRQVAEGWRIYTRPECADVVEHFLKEGQEVRLTQAALETMAVVAYRQPVSRGRVSAVRGVNCDGVMRTLVLRGLIEEAGQDPESGALLFRTTTYFLERLGLRSLDELPDLAPFLPDDIEGIDDTGERTT